MSESVVSRRMLLGSALISASVSVPSEFLRPPAPADLSFKAAVSISQSDLDKAAVVASPTRFNGIDPTGVNDSAPGLQAAMNATPEGGALVIPAGTYLLNTALSPRAGRSVRVLAYGATLVQNSSQPIVSVVGTYAAPVTVTSYSTVVQPGLGPQTKLNLLTSPGWVNGDLIKIVSDDVIPEGRPGTGDGNESRLGEFAVVRTVNGKTVYINGVLRENYGVNIRAAKISAQSFAIEGGSYQASDSRMQASNSPLLNFSKLFAPRLTNVRVLQAAGTAVKFGSCFAYEVRNLHVDRALDDAAIGQFGYGVLDNSCAFGLVDGGVFRHVRHAYTDDTNRVAANTDLGGYGRTYGATIANVTAVMTTNDSFDTHHCSDSVSFIGCTATGGLSQGQGQSGFKLRGVNHRVIACAATGTDGGLQIMTESGGGESRGHYVSDFRAIATGGSAVQVSVRQAGHPRAGERDVDNVQIRGITADKCESLLVGYNASITLNGGTFRAPAGAVGANTRAVYADNCQLVVQGVLLDFTTNTAGTPRVVVTGQRAGTQPGRVDTYLREVDVRSNLEVVSRSWAPFSGPGHLLRADGLFFSHPFRLMVGDEYLDGSAIDWKSDPVEGQPNAVVNSASFLFGNSDLNATVARLRFSTNSTLYLQGRTTVALEMPALPAGRFLGQRLIVHYVNNQTLTIRNGPAFGTRLLGNVDLVLGPDAVAELVWDGTAWRHV